ncbi:N-acetylmuramoyl-L-alanine amidase [Streptomyces cyaneofuscatus]|uniref:N-acetylmuramoyl-L-alanine amidase n=1 Tax=Streptomyces cyaneofuscatus TaxID=66883 RepID=A0ABZ1F441_9ACTN|nr:peptidoglycan-binding protein [Streptomyces cyaneofuscatus]WSB11186.1 amidase [Streptomyces cyaneofuscatus]WSD45281.1 amidase [Streptomyces cyaneofuscatus]WTA88475.1 amidase [Streptomyces cyaneofuscatus]
MPRSPAAARTRAGASLLAALTVTALVATGQPATAAPAPPAAEPLNRAFDRAARDYGVPRDLLAAVGYGESRLDGHAGKPSQANGYGVMHLASNPENRSLEKAAALTGEPADRLRRDTAANILGGAAVLRDHADRLGLDRTERRDVNAWYPAVARYSEAEGPAAALYADTVFTFLAQGLTATAPGGEEVRVPSRPVAPDKDEVSAAGVYAQSPDYPSGLWVPAYSGNFVVGRKATVDKVIIHTTQGSYAGSISWYQNPASKVSAHYTIRSSDGEVTQSVREKDTAWHAGSVNSSSVGIEHEGYVDNPAWYTEAMYRSSAALTKHLAARYSIPKDRSHIIGHSEAPGATHTDPGPNWDWNHYMQLVGGSPGTPGDSLTFPSYAVQQSGSSGAQVKAVQQLLNAQGYAAGTADGIFGPATKSATQAFQRARSLTADGAVGPKTWTALLSAGTTPALARGSSGDAVKRLQRSLTAALGTTVGADGSFGPTTESAVRTYQSGRGLSVDGKVGPATWGALQAGR